MPLGPGNAADRDGTAGGAFADVEDLSGSDP
jgi:hypothetical protein